MLSRIYNNYVIKASKEFENNSTILTRVFKIIDQIEFYFHKCVQN